MFVSMIIELLKTQTKNAYLAHPQYFSINFCLFFLMHSDLSVSWKIPPTSNFHLTSFAVFS